MLTQVVLRMSGDGVRASLGLELGFCPHVFHYVFVHEHEYWKLATLKYYFISFGVCFS